MAATPNLQCSTRLFCSPGSVSFCHLANFVVLLLLFAGDLLVGPAGFIDPSAPAQLALIGGLMREVYGDLQEVYTYYALLGKAQVHADRWVGPAVGHSLWRMHP